MTAFPTKLQQIEEGEEMKEKKAEENSGMESRADESKYNIFCICMFCFCSRKNNPINLLYMDQLRNKTIFIIKQKSANAPQQPMTYAAKLQSQLSPSVKSEYTDMTE